MAPLKTYADLGTLGPQIGRRGGQGFVRELPDHPGYLYKEYDPSQKVDIAGLQSLADWPSTLTPGDRKIITRHTAPLLAVIPDGPAPGVVIAKAPDQFFMTVNGKSKIRDLQWVANDTAAMGITPAPATTVLALARQAAQVMAVQHDNGLTWSDMSSTNGAFASTPKPTLMWFDQDSALRDGHPPALTEVETPDWRYPHSQPKTFVERVERDRWKLAMFIMRFYCRFQGRLLDCTRDVPLPDNRHPLSQDILSLLTQALRASGPRPTPRDWEPPLHALQIHLQNGGT